MKSLRGRYGLTVLDNATPERKIVQGQWLPALPLVVLTAQPFRSSKNAQRALVQSTARFHRGLNTRPAASHVRAELSPVPEPSLNMPNTVDSHALILPKAGSVITQNVPSIVLCQPGETLRIAPLVAMKARRRGRVLLLSQQSMVVLNVQLSASFTCVMQALVPFTARLVIGLPGRCAQRHAKMLSELEYSRVCVT